MFQGNGVALLANLSGMTDFFDLYDQQATKLDKELHELSADIASNSSNIETIRKNLNEVQAVPKREAR